MYEIEYNRKKAVAYAHKWAFERNPKYSNFDKMGGDCTNFASQALYAGCGVMNYNQVMGWYFNNINKRSPSWSGVEFFYNFLINNGSQGPYAINTNVENIMIGDIIQLKFSKESFGHSQVVVACGSPPSIDNIFVSTHTLNSDNRPLSTYNWSDIRFLHIMGARK